MDDSRLTTDRDMPGTFEGETVTRRRLFTAGAHTAGAIAGAAVVLPALGFAIGPVFERERAHWQAVGPATNFSADDYVPVTITIAEGIGPAGRSTAYVRRRDAAIDTERADAYNHYIAISTRCAHVGCPVKYATAAQSFICPCHGGVYDFRGRRTGGPPPRPLDRFYTRVRHGLVEIGPRFSLNNELRRFSPRDPGETLDGIGQYLYPGRLTTPREPR